MPRKRVDTSLAPLLPGMDDDFSVAARAKDVAKRLQLGNQVDEVVDFAIEYHDDAAVFVEQGLMAGGEVDDGQAPMAQAHPGLEVNPAFVRPAMELGLIHALEQGSRNFSAAAKIKNADYATHRDLTLHCSLFNFSF